MAVAARRGIGYAPDIMKIQTPDREYIDAVAGARNLLVLLLALLVLSRLIPLPGMQGIANYLPLHIFMETLSIVVAGMIFILGTHAYLGSNNFRPFILGCAFLAVALLDFGHLLTFPGMPALLEPGNAELSIAFWLFARFSAGIGLLLAAILHPRDLSLNLRLASVAGVLVLVACTYWIVLLHLDRLPSTFNEQTGLTSFKIGSEFALIALYGIASWLFWQQHRREQQTWLALLALAATIMMLSELFFTVYSNVTDVYNLLGHVYKLIAYAFLYRALIYTSIKAPFEEVHRLSTRIKATLDAMPDMMFEISSDGVIHQYHSNIRQKDLVAPPEAFLGRNIREFLPQEAVDSLLLSMADIDRTGYSTGHQYSLLVPSGMRRFEISGSELARTGNIAHYILVTRDVTARHLLKERMESMMALSAESAELDEKTLAQKALDSLEAMTHSKIGFLHIVSDDQQEIELLAWSTATLSSSCRAAYDNHYPVAKAGIWADCVRTRAPVVVNDYGKAENKKGLPEGHSELLRLISVPIQEDNKVRMVVGVANADYEYGDDAVKTVQLFGSELYQIIQRRRAERTSRRSQGILKAALDHLPVGVAINTVGDNVHFEYMNDNFPLFYRTSREALGSPDAFWKVVYEDPEERERIKARVLADYASGDPAQMVWENLPITRCNQQTRFVSAQNVLVPEEGLSVSLVLDVTDRLRIESELRVAATAFSSQGGIMITDAKRRILRVNSAFEKSSGYTQAEVLGQKPSMFSSGNHDANFYAGIWEVIAQEGVWHGEIWNRRKNGDVFPQSLTISAVRNAEGEITNYVGDFIDISNIKKAEAAISHLSYYDTLTGLSNRERLKNLLEAAIAMHQNAAQIGGLLMVDIDSFKTINDSISHDAGDALLIAVSERLLQSVLPGDTVSRYGGDKFILLLNNLGGNMEDSSLALQNIAQGILTRVEDTYTLSSVCYYSSCSAGATLFGDASTTSLELMKQLDIALYDAKKRGRKLISFFDPAWQTVVNERAQLLDDLRHGIAAHEFEMFYQPQLDKLGNIVGSEALVRWNHPRRGLLNPGEFIPLAEANGLMVKLGNEIMQMCLAQLARWQETRELRHLKLSINITADQFYEDGFEGQLKSLIAKNRLDVSGVMLEFTESMLLNKIDLARAIIERLNTLGVRFAIDDFGTGYSSLTYLSALPVDQLKIDQSFVFNIGISDKDAAIIRTIIDMARTLDMEVLAEGVETAAQRKYLLQHGCEFFQGYLFSRPVPLAQFNALVLQGPINVH